MNPGIGPQKPPEQKREPPGLHTFIHTLPMPKAVAISLSPFSSTKQQQPQPQQQQQQQQLEAARGDAPHAGQREALQWGSPSETRLPPSGIDGGARWGSQTPPMDSRDGHVGEACAAKSSAAKSSATWPSRLSSAASAHLGAPPPSSSSYSQPFTSAHPHQTSAASGPPPASAPMPLADPRCGEPSPNAHPWAFPVTPGSQPPQPMHGPQGSSTIAPADPPLAQPPFYASYNPHAPPPHAPPLHSQMMVPTPLSSYAHQ